MRSRCKPAHVNADFGDNHVGGRRADSRDSYQTCDRRVKGCHHRLDLLLESRDRLFQVRYRAEMLAQQKPMMRRDFAVQRRR